MEKPVYPKEWLDLRLEFKDEYLLNQNNKELNDKAVNDKEDKKQKPQEQLIEIPLEEPLYEMQRDYSKTLMKYDKSYNTCCKSSSCILM